MIGRRHRMRVIVVGYGVQGKKRLHFAGPDAVGIVDPFFDKADWQDVREVPLDVYDAALVCTPDAPKLHILRHLLENGKHALVEKPLFVDGDAQVLELERIARASRAYCYTAYNHRFEPHYVRMRDLIRSGVLGRIYSCRMFYGNGTARLVRESAWRDQEAGVLPDLGSHLLDTCRFWFGDAERSFELSSVRCFENRAPDHVVIASEGADPRIELEMTLLMWRNHFTCDILAENGTAHISSLCKWGPTTFTYRRRVLPSGRPPEECVTLVQDDPTWALEYAAFNAACEAGVLTDLSNDLWLHRTLSSLSGQATTLTRSA